MSSGDSVVDAVTAKVLAASALEEPNEAESARYEATGALRELLSRFGTAALSADRLREVERLVRCALAELNVPDGPEPLRHARSPLMGRASALAPPLKLWFEPDRVVGNVCFGPQYEAAQGTVHGGFVAGVLDDLLGAAQTLSGTAGMTGTLTVRYLRPTPIEVDLQLTATLKRVQDRKIVVTGDCRYSDIVTSEAEAIFISVPVERFGLRQNTTGGVAS